MIINFVGSPCSGKTTTAASLFAKLKEDGHPAEFLTEQARLHIATKRFNLKLKPEEKVTVGDYDQQLIMSSQLHYETMLAEVCGPDMTVVTDSSYLNAILYMTEESKNHHLKGVLENYVEIASRHPRLIFICSGVKPPAATDPNRVHSYEESLEIEKKIPEILQKYAPNIPTVQLVGSTFNRYNTVITEVFMRLAGCL